MIELTDVEAAARRLAGVAHRTPVVTSRTLDRLVGAEEVVTYDRWTQDRVALGAALAQERGLTLVKPYDDPLVMAGQGTAALELVEDAGPLEALVVPVGGGGLIAGCATAAKGIRP